MTLWVALREGEAGRMPARCVRTGERCINRTALPVTSLHPAPEWFTWSGLWPLGRRHASHGVVVSLLPGRARAATWLRQLRDLTAVMAVVLLVVSLATDIQFVDRLLLTTVGLKVVVALVGLLWSPFARVDRSGEWVRLSNVRGDAIELAGTVLTEPESEPRMTSAITLRPVPTVIARDRG